MGKLINCHVCNKEKAKSAKVCPHCGAKKKSSWLFKIGGTFVLSVIVVSFLISEADIESGGGASPAISSSEPKPGKDAYKDVGALDYRKAVLKEIDAGTKVGALGSVIHIDGNEVLLATGGEFLNYTENYVYLIFSENPKVLAGDAIEVHGRYKGIKPYTGFLGGGRNLPYIAADYYTVVKKAD